MDHLLAFRVADKAHPKVHRISLDPATIEALQGQSAHAPAVIVVRKAAMIAGMKAGMIDPVDVVSLAHGDWSNAVLIQLDEEEVERQSAWQAAGDSEFLVQVEQGAPNLAKLAAETVAAIRKAGVDGELVEGSGGRWVNRPLNTFTLKAQPRAGNLHFTLYGNPQTYDASDFLLKDQNSYSRGWVKTSKDVTQLAELVQISHARRRR